MNEKSDIGVNPRRPPPLPPRAPSILSSAQNSQPSPSSSSPQPSGSSFSDAPPSYNSIFRPSSDNALPPLAANDPRSSSTQSLVPTRSSEQNDRRRLLLIFIHGFMGDETSFQSFPAHVHDLVATLVAESHVVHTKLYPRYRSRKNIEFTRDDFSRWLAPHEAAMTDVVLLGHSMGGLVSAEVALSQVPATRQLKHRILGTINFDVPFLGMHPSVIKSGLSSIFNPAPESPNVQTDPASTPVTSPGAAPPVSGNASTAGRDSKPPPLPPRSASTLSNPQRVDPNYNPMFENDVRLPVRKGWRNAWHFVSKHNEDLLNATKQLVKSHLEFGGAMADYSGLKNRYCRIRALEEQNPDIRRSVMGASESPPRVRFVNYYTSSTGRPEKQNSPATTADVTAGNSAESIHFGTGQSIGASQDTPAAEPTMEPAIQTDLTSPAEEISSEVAKSPLLMVEHPDEDKDDDDEDSSYDLQESNLALDHDMDHLDPAPMSDYGGDTSDTDSWADAMEDLHLPAAKPTSTVEDDELPIAGSAIDGDSEAVSKPIETILPSTTAALSANDSDLSLATTNTLPPIPDTPTRPPEPDYSVYVDKETRKLAEKDYARTLKTYERAVRDRDRAIRDREKLEEKRQRQAQKEGKRAEKDAEKEAKRKEKEAEKASKQNDESQKQAHDKTFELQRRETEREWKEALEMKWNDEDGTVTPMPSAPTSAGASTYSSSLAPTNSLTTVTTISSQKTSNDASLRPKKPRTERNFCALPPKDSAGNRDPAWVKVFMPGVDEVGAHCGLFFETSPAYEQLIGDVGDKISEWLNDARD